MIFLRLIRKKLLKKKQLVYRKILLFQQKIDQIHMQVKIWSLKITEMPSN